jgi:hypothetical protein
MVKMPSSKPMSKPSKPKAPLKKGGGKGGKC